MSEYRYSPTQEALFVLAKMKQRAGELNIQGVSEVTTAALILEMLKLLGASQKELNGYRQLSLIQLIQEITANSANFPAIIPVLNDIVCRFARDPDKSKSPEDNGRNYLAAVGGKLAQMLRTGKNSGVGDSRASEFAVEGGIINRRIAAAFSGGTSDQDKRVAIHGAASYMVLLQKQRLAQRQIKVE
ncbi:MAG: hypothetical protein AAB612_00860 [Patescibacteria group bacterium]|mgnify:FL=1